MKKKFEDLSRVEQVEAVRQEMLKPGTSNKKAADALGTTQGTVAGIRHKNNIPSTNKAPGMGGKKRQVQKPQEAQKLKPAPPVPKPQVPQPAPRQTAKVPAPLPGMRVSPSEASRCESKKLHCPYEAEVGSRFCRLHKNEK